MRLAVVRPTKAERLDEESRLCGDENFTEFLPMDLDEIERLVLEKGVVQKVPPTRADAIRTGR